jgi:SAM-dependent methyltransferase
MSGGDFYRAFEDRYRGSRELIKERQRAYLPFVAPLAGPADETAAVALDLGCGRGEWLELLGEHGFAARGVDLDDGMLAACRERGLAVETADAIGALRALADDSVAVVSAFHLVEHLPFEAVQELVAQSLRVLRPGGLLTMETPNPENPTVGACNFYLDPSHERPLPPLLLSFTAEHAGFGRVKVVRLQEDPQLHTAAAIRLINVLAGASPDYGVVAQKTAPADVLAPFDQPFGREYGIGIGELAQRFEDDQAAAVGARLAGIEASLAQTAARSAELADGLSRADLRLAQYEARLAEANLRTTEVQAQLSANQVQHELQRSELEQLRARVAAVETDKEQAIAALRAHAADVEERLARKDRELAEAHSQLAALHRSTSWRLTAPLRWIGSLFHARR